MSLSSLCAAVHGGCGHAYLSDFSVLLFDANSSTSPWYSSSAFHIHRWCFPLSFLFDQVLIFDISGFSYCKSQSCCCIFLPYHWPVYWHCWFSRWYVAVFLCVADLPLSVLDWIHLLIYILWSLINFTRTFLKPSSDTLPISVILGSTVEEWWSLGEAVLSHSLLFVLILPLACLLFVYIFFWLGVIFLLSSLHLNHQYHLVRRKQATIV